MVTGGEQTGSLLAGPFFALTPHRRFAEVPWESSAIALITWLTVFTSQLFFASRCYTLYGRSKIVFGGLLLGRCWSIVTGETLKFKLIVLWTGMTVCLGIFAFLAAMIAIDPFNFPILAKIGKRISSFLFGAQMSFLRLTERPAAISGLAINVGKRAISTAASRRTNTDGFWR